jgi:hypothetical protein
MLAVERAQELSRIEDVVEGVVVPLQRYGTLPAAFDGQSKKERFSLMAHTPAEIRWVTSPYVFRPKLTVVLGLNA